MNLTQAIEQYSGTDQEVLSAVRLHPVIKGELVSSEVLTMYLVSHGLYTVFLNSDHPICIATMNSIASLGEFNFMLGTVKGEMNLMSLDILIRDGLATEALKSDLVSLANPETYPFLDLTEHDFKKAKYPGTWGIVADNIPNEVNKHLTARFAITSSIYFNDVVYFRIYIKLRNNNVGTYMLMPQSLVTESLEIQENETQILDVPLPQDKLISNYQIQFKEPWQGITQSVEFIGIL